MKLMRGYLIIFTSVVSIIHVDAVTVNPSLCPTNKIAPHRRQLSWDQGQAKPRTFGLIYDLLAPPRRPQPYVPLNDLEEQPQEDDPDDCGEIDDYDETDLSSVTPGAQKRKDRDHRYFFDNNYNRPPYYPTPSRPISPSKPQRPQRPTRPPYNQGTYGFFHQHQSDYIKPVKEDTFDHPQATYRPGLVGGVLGHIVGVPPIRPTTELPPQRRPTNTNGFRFPENDSHHMNNRRKKSQQSYNNKSTNIVGSFVDLLFN